MKRKLVALPLFFALFACGTSIDGTSLTAQDLTEGPFSGESQVLDRASAEARAQSFFGGIVLSSNVEVERGISVFEVYVRLDSGAIIEVKLEEATGHVVEIEGKSGPFTDALDPGPDFISLDKAIDAAREIRSGEVTGWELELDDGLTWVWEIEIGAQKVKLDARSGALRDDNHGRDPWDDHYEDNRASEAPEEIVRTAEQIVEGAVYETQRELEHGVDVWKLKLRTQSSAEVEVYLLAEGGALLRVRDDSGPFDYDVRPGRGWLNLSEALESANVSATSILEYRLDREDGTFVYELRFEAGEEERRVFIDAATGAQR